MSKSLDAVEDWFGRRAEDGYTFNSGKQAFGVDSKRGSQAAYLIGGAHGKVELKDTAKLLGSMFRVVGVPKDIQLTPTETGKAGGLHVPLHLLRDEKTGKYTTEGAQADAFLGLSLQNASMAALQLKSEYQKGLDAAKTETTGFNLKKFIFNLLNIERVSKEFADDFPGYSKFIQAYKQHAFDKNYTPLEADADPSLRLLDLITKMIRFPKHVTREELDEFAKPMESIARLLKRYGGEIPSTFEECDSMANSLQRIIVDYVPDEEEEEPMPGPGGSGPGKPGGGAGSGIPGGGTGGFTHTKNPTPGEGESENPEEEEGGSGTGEEEEETSPSSAERKGPVGVGHSAGGAPMKSRAERKAELEKHAKELTEKLVTPESKDDEELSKDDEEEFKSAFEEFVEDMTPEKEEIDPESYGSKGEYISWEVGVDSPEQYKRDALKIDMVKASVLRTLFTRKSKHLQFTMKGMKSGRFDTNKLAEAVQGVQTVYERMGEVTTNKVCVGVLIDESGSMGGSKIEKARQAAIFINETFGKLRDVELFIYGHTADSRRRPAGAGSAPGWGGSGTTDMTIYREPGKSVPQFALGGVEAQANNRDGVAILAVAHRIRKFTQNQGIFIVISDGAPAASGYGNGVEDTKLKVSQAEKLGFQVVQIAIDSSVPSERMFTHFIKMTNIKELPNDMIRYMSRRVDAMIKQTVSL